MGFKKSALARIGRSEYMQADYCDSCGINVTNLGDYLSVEISGGSNYKIELRLCNECSGKLQQAIAGFWTKWGEPNQLEKYVYIPSSASGDTDDDDREVSSKSDGVCFTCEHWPR